MIRGVGLRAPSEKEMKESKPSETREAIDTLTIFTILVRCPKGGTPNATCPFVQFRDSYNLEEKFQYAESLPAGKRLKMLDFHNHCLATAYAKQNDSN